MFTLFGGGFGKFVARVTIRTDGKKFQDVKVNAATL